MMTSGFVPQVQFLPPVADRCASAPGPPVDRAGGGILAASCTSAWSTGPLYILLSAHFRAGGETWQKKKRKEYEKHVALEKISLL